MYYIEDLALEKSNPLATHIVLDWKYSLEMKKDEKLIKALKKEYKYFWGWNYRAYGRRNGALRDITEGR